MRRRVLSHSGLSLPFFYSADRVADLVCGGTVGREAQVSFHFRQGVRRSVEEQKHLGKRVIDRRIRRVCGPRNPEMTLGFDVVAQAVVGPAELVVDLPGFRTVLRRLRKIAVEGTACCRPI